MSKTVLSVTPPDIALLVSFLNADLERDFPRWNEKPGNKLGDLLLMFEQDAERAWSDRGITQQRQKVINRLAGDAANETQRDLRKILGGVLDGERQSRTVLAARITNAGGFTYRLDGKALVREPMRPGGTAWLYKIIVESLEQGDFKKLRRCKECGRFFIAGHLKMRFCGQRCYKAFFAADAARRVRLSRERRAERRRRLEAAQRR